MDIEFHAHHAWLAIQIPQSIIFEFFSIAFHNERSTFHDSKYELRNLNIFGYILQ